MLKRVNGCIEIILGLIIAIGPYTFLHVCGDGMKMMEGMSGPVCKGIPPIALVVGIVVAVSGLALLLLSLRNKSNVIQTIVSIIVLIAGVVTIGLPVFIVGVCDEVHMHCHMVTKPALIILGAVSVLSAVLGIILNLTNKEVEKK